MIEAGHHIAHATATFSELSLALSIGMWAKIIRPPTLDALTRGTSREKTRQILRISDGGFVLLVFNISCYISDIGSILQSYTPIISVFLSVVALLGLAFFEGGDVVLFMMSSLSFALIVLYINKYRKQLSKTGEAPEIEPEI